MNQDVNRYGFNLYAVLIAKSGSYAGINVIDIAADWTNLECETRKQRLSTVVIPLPTHQYRIEISPCEQEIIRRGHLEFWPQRKVRNDLSNRCLSKWFEARDRMMRTVTKHSWKNMRRRRAGALKSVL